MSNPTTTLAKSYSRCVLPSPTEQELATLPGPDPDTALRVRVEGGPEGYVRLEQLAFTLGLGWYTQKSFCIPGEMLAALVPQLRKADCLIPRRRPAAVDTDAPPLRLPVPTITREATRDAERREA